MNTDEKIDYAIKLLLGMDLRLAALEKLAAGYKPEAPPADDTPAKTGGIYDFKRPDPAEPRHGLGQKMYSPDEKEFIERSRFAVRYNGNLALGPAQEEEAWAEITAIQTGDPGIIEVYADAGIDPMLVAVLLMQGRIDPVKYDGPTFGNAAQKRAALVGMTPGSWLQNEFDIMAGGAAPSGGEYGE